MVWVFLLVVVTFVAVAAFGLRRRSAAAEQPASLVQRELASRGFKPTYLLRTETHALALDEGQRLLAMVTFSAQRPTVRVVPHDAIISSTVLRDDTPVAIAQRGAVPLEPPGVPAASDAPGTTPAPMVRGIGSIVGGHLPDQPEIPLAKVRLSRLALRVTIDDVRVPEFNLPLIRLQRPEFLTAFWLRPQVQAVEEWHTRLAELIRQADVERASNAPAALADLHAAYLAQQQAASDGATAAQSPQPSAPAAVAAAAAPPQPHSNGAAPSVATSVADELQKLVQMFERGLLTKEQFESAKQKLLLASS